MHRWLGLILMLASGTAWGCSCVSQGGCGALKPHGAMFVGMVISIADEPPNADKFASYRRKIVRFSVGESFSGTQRAGEEITIMTGMGGGDCGFPFEVAKRYFVDGYVSSTGIGAGICGLTSTEPAATATIRELRTVASGGRVPDLSGTVATDGYRGPPNDRSKGLAGVVVTVTTADGTRHQTHTDRDGMYAFETLPSEKYIVQAALPEQYASEAEADDKPQTVTIPNVGGVGAACHLDMPAEPGGRIIGRAVDANGKGVAGFVAAYAVPQADIRSGSDAATSVDKDGKFTLLFLAHGEYRVEFWVNGDIKQTVYYPGTQKEVDAATVHVEEGKATEEIVIPVK